MREDTGTFRGKQRGKHGPSGVRGDMQEAARAKTRDAVGFRSKDNDMQGASGDQTRLNTPGHLRGHEGGNAESLRGKERGMQAALGRDIGTLRSPEARTLRQQGLQWTWRGLNGKEGQMHTA